MAHVRAMSSLMLDNLETNIKAKYDSALESRDLYFFETTSETKDVNGVEFQLTHAPSLLLKPKPEGVGEQDVADPFENPNPALRITEYGDYNLVLNKFCVVPHHFLIVTKEFKKQSEPLLPGDLRVTWEVLNQLSQPAMAFYNCGDVSGASQPHKHIQVIPLPKSKYTPPINALYDRISGRKAGEIYTIESLPYIHVLVPLDLNFIGTSTDPEEMEGYMGQMFFGLLDSMIQQLRVNGSQMTMSYNFILTKQYMMLVPRQKEHWEVPDKGIRLSVNSMAFAGYLLTKKPEEFEAMKDISILDILSEVGVPKNKETSVLIVDSHSELAV
ncbi:bifunctional AP-4-A phosphorylase/ADP sulfurylase [Umbelopsis sp. WA50703]